jgi:ribosomal protein S18 acetylase RimI-like enzyme
MSSASGKPDALLVSAPKIALRRALESDRAFVECVYFETQRWIIEALLGWRGDDVESERFAEQYDAPNTSIVTVDGEDAGWLTVQRGSDIYLQSIYLVAKHQRRGIGTRLLQALLDEGRERGTAVRLDTARINPARRLYERLGFTTISEDRFKIYMQSTSCGSG